MTTETNKRCAHCGAEYVFQGSGHGCLRATNDGTWCPSCKQATINALRAIPRQFEQRWQDIAKLREESLKYMSAPYQDARVQRATLVTLDMMLAWERRTATEDQAKGTIRFTQIWPSLVKIETGESQYIRRVFGHDEYRGMQFRVSTWPSSPVEHSIEIPMEYDLINERLTGAYWR